MGQNRTRVELHHKLVSMLGSNNVYFDPPENFKLQYPCIVYYLEGLADSSADNQVYRRMRRYSLTYITPIAEDPFAEELADIRYCTLNRPYTVSDLYHWAYTLFY